MRIFLLLAFSFAQQSTMAGTVIGWGSNISGEATGTPSFLSSNGIVIITDNPYATGIVTVAGSALTNAVAISAGNGFSLAIRGDRTAVAWGDNQANRAIGIVTPSPYRTNGAVIADGKVLSDVVSVATGGSFSLALQRSGKVVTWGKNTVPVGLSNVVAIAANEFWSLALRKDGQVVSWGSTPWSQTAVPNGLDTAVSVAVGGGGNIIRQAALTKEGSIVTWGTETSFGDATPPPGLSNVVAIAVGYNHTLALQGDGRVVGWGFNASGQATGVSTKEKPYVSAGFVKLNGQVLNDVSAIAASYEYSLALKKNGTVVAWGNKRFYRDVPAGLTNVTAISAGHGFCLAITTNSSAFTTTK